MRAPIGAHILYGQKDGVRWDIVLEHPGNFTHFKLRRQEEFPVLQEFPDSFNDIEEMSDLSESEKQALKKRAITAVAYTLGTKFCLGGQILASTSNSAGTFAQKQ